MASPFMVTVHEKNVRKLIFFVLEKMSKCSRAGVKARSTSQTRKFVTKSDELGEIIQDCDDCLKIASSEKCLIIVAITDYVYPSYVFNCLFNPFSQPALEHLEN